MKTFIISGKSGHGKDVLANYLKEAAEKQNKTCVILHFADALKWLLKECYHWDGTKDEHGRFLLQHIGTDVIRTKFPHFWAMFVAQFLAAVSNDFDVAIVPDARFINEIDITKRYTDAKVIRIIRYQDGFEYYNPALTIQQHNHASEISLDNYPDFDYIVENNNLEDLPFAAERILEDALT